MPKQISLEEIKEQYTRQFLDYYDDGSKYPQTKLFGMQLDFITTYFTEFAEGLMFERYDLDPFAERPTRERYENTGYNQAVDELNSNINKALGKE